MRIVGLQWDLQWENKAENFAQVEALTVAAAPEPGSLIILPEMFATGFSMNVPGIAEKEGGETLSFLSALAVRHRVYVLAGVVTIGPNGQGCNEAVIVDPEGKETARYRKMHPFTYAGESEFYESGSAPILWSEGGLVTTPFICYDLRFPEIFRLAANRGAELFVVIANWPASRVEHWRLLLRARAVENQAYVVGVNRCGSDPKLAYPGASLVVDPQGAIVAELNAEEGLLQAEIDGERVRKCRRDFPFLRDMRTDLFRE